MEILWLSGFRFKKLPQSLKHILKGKNKTKQPVVLKVNVWVTWDTFNLRIDEKNWGMRTSFWIILFFPPSWPGCPCWQVILQWVLLAQKSGLVSACLGTWDTLGWIHLKSHLSWLPQVPEGGPCRGHHTLNTIKQCCHGISILYRSSQAHHPKSDL